MNQIHTYTNTALSIIPIIISYLFMKYSNVQILKGYTYHTTASNLLVIAVKNPLNMFIRCEAMILETLE